MIIDDKEWHEIESWIIETRRNIHRFPEMGLNTIRTRGIVEEALDYWGIPHSRPIANGVKAWLGPDQGNALLLRGDMDALPIMETTGLPFASEVAGCMHACGHDCHTAMLLGAARYLKTHEHELTRPVVIIQKLLTNIKKPASFMIKK